MVKLKYINTRNTSKKKEAKPHINKKKKLSKTLFSPPNYVADQQAHHDAILIF